MTHPLPSDDEDVDFSVVVSTTLVTTRLARRASGPSRGETDHVDVPAPSTDRKEHG
jgi:hypothetical protein